MCTHRIGSGRCARAPRRLCADVCTCTAQVKYWREVLGGLLHVLLPGPASGERGHSSSKACAQEGGAGEQPEYVDAMRRGVIAIVCDILAGKVMGQCYANLADRLDLAIVAAVKQVCLMCLPYVSAVCVCLLCLPDVSA